MKRKNLSICIILVVLAALFGTQIFSASAVTAPLYRGDVDYNGKTGIDDVTLLQKYIANEVEFNKRQIYTGDVDVDGKITVDDVTIVQKHCAGLIGPLNPPDGIRDKVDIFNFYSDYNSGKAPVGTPITFYTEAWGGVQPFTYEYYVNGNLASDRAEENSFTYTFDEIGSYDITVRVYNIFDEYDEYTQSFEVVEEYSSEYPVICSIHLNSLKIQTEDSRINLTADAILGTKPYEYSFSLDNGVYVQDYSENNNFDLEPYLIEINEGALSCYLEAGTHTVEISVKDSSGKTSTENFDFEVV